MSAAVRDRQVDRVTAALEGRASQIGRDDHRTILAGILASAEPDSQARAGLRRDALLAMARDRHVLGKKLITRLLAVVVPHKPEAVRWQCWGRIIRSGTSGAGYAAQLAAGGAR